MGHGGKDLLFLLPFEQHAAGPENARQNILHMPLETNTIYECLR